MKKGIILSSLSVLLLILFITYRYHVYQERYDMVKFYEFSDEVDHLTKVESDEVYTSKVNSLEKKYLKSLYSCDAKDKNDALNVILNAENKRYEIKRERIQREVNIIDAKNSKKEKEYILKRIKVEELSRKIDSKFKKFDYELENQLKELKIQDSIHKHHMKVLYN